MGAQACKSNLSNPSATGQVKVYGMPISGNVMPSCMLAMDFACGGFEFKDMMKGELKTPEMVAINPWTQMPSMSDGSFYLAESNAILRYIANTYAPEAYGGNDIKRKAIIDWALDWASTNFSKSYSAIWYPVAGFGAPPDDQKKANADAVENLKKFEGKFLTKGKFVDGDTCSIADYKIGVTMWYLDHPTIKQKTGFELTPRMKTYVKDFLSVTKSQSFLDAADGFMKSKA
mmetsp:Transcript_156996/g.273373  ORF Transcript_156996/g.273373 Transcript_156996/m.273373 type:complete len:231 (+) Transcript_156996:91-783(+)